MKNNRLNDLIELLCIGAAVCLGLLLIGMLVNALDRVIYYETPIAKGTVVAFDLEEDASSCQALLDNGQSYALSGGCCDELITGLEIKVSSKHSNLFGWTQNMCEVRE